MRKFYVKRILLFAFISFIFGHCGKETVNLREMSPEQQFEYAKSIFDKRDFNKAKLQFTIVVMNNPGSLVIEKAQFFLAESYYNLKEYILAIEEYEKLIRSLPQSPYVDDARYKIGMSYYKLAPGYALDQEYTKKAISQFQLFLEEFTSSDLKDEVNQRLQECRSKLAKKEYKNGELYRKMSSFRAALISFDRVLEQYYDTEFAVDALYWKGECHRKLEEYQEAENAFQELLTKHRQSQYAKRAEDKLKSLKEKGQKRAQSS
jgi:outer membrane protein assembly factor BamD